MAFSTLPSSTRKNSIKSFHVELPQDDMSTLLRLSKLPPETFETCNSGSKYGVTKEWMEGARDEFLNRLNGM